MTKMTGIVLCVLMALVILREWTADAEWLLWLRIAAVLAVLVLVTPRVRLGRQAFVAVAVILTTLLLVTQAQAAPEILSRAFDSAAFIGAYFCGLSTLQYAAGKARTVREAGQFLASQRPGRRYLALTFGTQLFAFLLNYGAISLLGTLASANAGQEQNVEVRFHRRRRMLIAIQRGFISVLPWSPLSFAVAVTVSLVPDISWSDILGPSLISSLILAGVGLALDSLFKPRLSRPAQPADPVGSWWSLAPLGVLFAALAVLVSLFYSLTDVRIVGIVLLIVPLMALFWLYLQQRDDPAPTPLRDDLREIVFTAFPGYRSELVLLMMAGFIGTVAAPLLSPMLGGVAGAMTTLPGWITLVALVWLIPLGGQLGMNPILVVTMLVPLLPAAASLGVRPEALAVALTCGWALSGATSPFTATTVLIGGMGDVTPRHVGLRWNGPYALLTGGILSGWVVLFSALIA